MDWKAFADIVGHLAWPLIALVIALLFRKPISDLLRRLKNIKGPGLEAGFEKVLEESKDEAERIKEDQDSESSEPAEPTPIQATELQLAQQFPAAAIFEAYAQIDALTRQIRQRLPDREARPHRAPSDAIAAARRMGYLTDSAEVLYKRLTVARNLVAHGKDDASAASAVEYWQQSKVLETALRDALAKLPPLQG
jgi:hypothetical protein